MSRVAWTVLGLLALGVVLAQPRLAPCFEDGSGMCLTLRLR